MFNKARFKAELALRGIPIKRAAEVMGLSTTTLWRRLNGKSEFTAREMTAFSALVGWENLKAIFFDENVS